MAATPGLIDLSPEDFVAKVFSRRSRMMRQTFSRQNKILSPEDIAGLAAEEFVESRLVVHTPRDQSWALRYGPFVQKDFAKLPQKHWTLLVQDVDKFVPEVSDLVDLIDFLPHAWFDDIMVSYARTGGSVGAHVDQYHVFLVQAAGNRRWQIEEKVRKDADYREGLDLRLLKDFHPTQTFIAQPGDVLYLPPGIPHHGVSLDDHCVTYSIGLRAPSLSQLFLSFAQYIAESDKGEVLLEHALQQATKHCGKISGKDLLQAQHTMASLLNDKTLFQTWWGQYLSEPKLALDSIPSPSIPSKTLVRDENCRAYYYEEGGKLSFFVNGLKLPSRKGDYPVIRKICNSRRVQFDSKALPKWLVDLVKQGHWYYD